MLQGAETRGFKDDVERAVLRAQDPADDDGRDHHRQDLRQVVGRPQEAGQPATELLADQVEQHGRQQEPHQGGDDDHRDDHRHAVGERGPELLVTHQPGPVLQPDPPRWPDAAIPGEAEIDVPDQRDQHDPGEQDEPRQQIPPEPAPGAGREQALAVALLRPPR